MSRALIVDDNQENRYLLKCLLSAEGYEVVEANNGREALESTKTNQFDLAISDILMPIMDGFSLCRAWKSNPELSQIPFVFYTATYTDPKDEVFALSLGADQFIVKPMDPVALREQIREVVQRQRGGALNRGAQTSSEENPYLQQYNAVLVRKLEDKLLELAQANQALLVKEFAIASSTSGVVLTDLFGTITYANPAMCRWCGRSPADILGHNMDQLVGLPDDWTARISGADREWHVEAQLKAETDVGAAVWLRVSAHKIVAQDGQQLGIMLSCQDVSEEKRLRQELSRIQQLESLGQFAAGVAHDFNNLLMSIFAALELDGIPDVSDRERQEYRAMALAGFERAKDLTRRLLVFSKASVTNRRAVDLCQLLEECIALGLSGSGIQCERQYAPGKHWVFADPGQLSRVFSNLLVNARQAMRDRGSMVVVVDVGGPKQDERAGAGALGCVTVRITDSGPGIAPDVLPRIFEPYYTTKAEGSGLGLPTSQAIVLEHGGHIQATSQPGVGATFEVCLPRSVEGCEPPRLAAAEKPTGSAGRILLMDDQATIQALTQRTLERAGYSVVVVGNGEQALLEFARAKSLGLPFDLVLLDFTVRGGMGGVETLSEMRRSDKTVPAIASTGYSDQVTTMYLLEHGFSAVLGKPFLAHELLATIGTTLPSRSPTTDRSPTRACSSN
jgi:two-component system, cell cycle sensor histidine kinase and response regulator CckA